MSELTLDFGALKQVPDKLGNIWITDAFWVAIPRNGFILYIIHGQFYSRPVTDC